jgi:hypothetical protein
MKHIQTFESFLNEAFRDTRTIVGKGMDDILDALKFLQSGIGKAALDKECKGNPYTIFLTDENGFPKPGGLHMSSINIVANGSNPKLSVEEFIDCVNKVFNDHGYDKYKVKIEK